jgi:hypothetical protein
VRAFAGAAVRVAFFRAKRRWRIVGLAPAAVARENALSPMI